MRARNHRMELIALMASVMGLSGCVGAVVQHDDRTDLAAPQIKPDGTVQSCPLVTSLSKADVLRIWGPPTRIARISDSKERWTYRSSELRWVGIELVALFPLPLIVPVGHEKVTLTFQDDRLMRAEVLKQDESHALFGLMAGPCGLSGRFHDIGGESQGRDPGKRTVNPTWIEDAKKD